MKLDKRDAASEANSNHRNGTTSDDDITVDISDTESVSSDRRKWMRDYLVNFSTFTE